MFELLFNKGLFLSIFVKLFRKPILKSICLRLLLHLQLSHDFIWEIHLSSSYKYAFMGFRRKQLMVLNDLWSTSDITLWSERLNILEDQAVLLADSKVIFPGNMKWYNSMVKLAIFKGKILRWLLSRKRCN